uniref:NAC transcription factor 32 n=1 Tax=Rheum palmatum TaxID=137221 RepID=A0AA49XE96_RHEPA|nr:NAC transcription factor 32 [Rheum palmatum]
MVKIAKNKSSISREKKNGKSTAVTDKKGKEKKKQEYEVLYNRLKEEHEKNHREWVLKEMVYQERLKKIQNEKLTKRFVELGYVFSPTEGKLVDYYLRNKNLCNPMDLCPIEEVDVYANHPQTLAEKHPNEAQVWYFFTRSRPNEVQEVHDVRGQWVTCDKIDLFYQGEKVGVKLLLEYCEGGHKSEYKIIEYQLDPAPESSENWFICKLYNGGCVDVHFQP